MQPRINASTQLHDGLSHHHHNNMLNSGGPPPHQPSHPMFHHSQSPAGYQGMPPQQQQPAHPFAQGYYQPMLNPSLQFGNQPGLRASSGNISQAPAHYHTGQGNASVGQFTTVIPYPPGNAATGGSQPPPPYYHTGPGGFYQMPAVPRSMAPAPPAYLPQHQQVSYPAQPAQPPTQIQSGGPAGDTMLQQPNHAGRQPAVTPSATVPVPSAHRRSHAIAIVNPVTLEEVKVDKSTSPSPSTTTRSTPESNTDQNKSNASAVFAKQVAAACFGTPIPKEKERQDVDKTVVEVDKIVVEEKEESVDIQQEENKVKEEDVEVIVNAHSDDKDKSDDVSLPERTNIIENGDIDLVEAEEEVSKEQHIDDEVAVIEVEERLDVKVEVKEGMVLISNEEDMNVEVVSVIDESKKEEDCVDDGESLNASEVVTDGGEVKREEAEVITTTENTDNNISTTELIPKNIEMTNNVNDVGNFADETSPSDEVEIPSPEPDVTHLQDGKYVYDRDFLLGMQSSDVCNEKPDDLQILSDIMRDSPANNNRRGQPPQPSNFMDLANFSPGHMGILPFPGSIPGRLPNRNSQRGGGGGPRGSQKGSKIRQIPSITLNVSTREVVRLSSAGDKAWKPAHKDASVTDDKDPDEIKTEELLKKVRGILNKLTPQKFKTLAEQVIALEIDTETKLRGIINLVFEKAVGEPAFSVAYANLCKCLLTLKVQSKENPDTTVFAKKILLNKCQQEFEKDLSDDVAFDKLRVQIENSETEEEKKRLSDELQQAQVKSRRRSLGNTRFIGELFKLRILTEQIMHDCVVRLLRDDSDEESLEGLCRLMATIGKDLDPEGGSKKMDYYIKRIRDIINGRKISSRVRFGLQDVADLRMNNWKPRREEGPKTIDQIHKEAAQERQQNDILNIIHADSKKINSKDNSRPPQYQGRNSAGPTLSKEWQSVTKNSNKLDPSRLKLNPIKPSDDMKLGPGRSMGWGTGSTGGGASKSSGMDVANKYSVLDKEPDNRNLPPRLLRNQRGGGGVEREREDAISNVKSFMGPPSSTPPLRPQSAQGMSGPMRQLSQPRSDSRPNSRSGSGSRPESQADSSRSSSRRGSQQGSRGGSRPGSRSGSRSGSRGDPRAANTTPTPTVAAEVKKMTEVEMERRSHLITDEFVENKNEKEALECLTEFSRQGDLSVFVLHSISKVIEKSNGKSHELLGQLLATALRKNVILISHVLTGLSSVTSTLEDLVIDIPHIHTYLGEILGNMFELVLPVLQDVTRPIADKQLAGKLVVATTKSAAQRLGSDSVGTLCRHQSFNWEPFVPPGTDVQKYIVEFSVEYTIAEKVEAATGDANCTVTAITSDKATTGEEMRMSLESILVAYQDDVKKCSEAIFDWVSKSISKPEEEGKTFIRSLISSIVKACLNSDNKGLVLDKDKLKELTPILKKYLDNVAEREKQALFGLQFLMAHHQHPKGILRGIFDALYDEEVISEDAFHEWETSEEELEGKGVAVKSVAQFFTWLKEAEPEDADTSNDPLDDSTNSSV